VFFEDIFTFTLWVKKGGSSEIANNLSKVTLKKGEEAVTGKIGIGWMAESLKYFGLKRIISVEYCQAKKSNREKDAYEKILSVVMMRASGGERLEDIENLRADRGLLDSLGWKEMVCADTAIDFIGDRRNNAKMRRGKKNSRMIMTRRIWTVARNVRNIRIKSGGR